MSNPISHPVSGTASIDSVLSGARWDSTAITIKFPQNPAYVGYTVSAGNFGNLDASQQSAFRAILNRWASVANLTFTMVGEQQQADISVYWYTSVTDPTHVYGLGSVSVEAGDIQLGALNAADLSQPGSAGYFYALQAIGQALGLKAPLSSDGLYVSDTVMSSQSYAGHSSGAYPIAAGSYPSAPMLNDIAAIEHLYGPNDNALTGNLGDTTYTFDPGASLIFQTRIDGGGNDTFNFSGYTTNLSIDLRAGHWTDLGGQYATLDTGNAGVKPPGNIAIYGSEARYVIENAYGGSGDDTLIGNAADNVLRGNGGNDVLKPGAGSDTLTGGAGNDTFDVSDGEGGQKQITDFGAGDAIKLRDAVAGGAITQGDGASLTSGQIAFGTNGASNVLRVGLDSTPGADLTIALGGGVGLDNLSVSGQTISYIADVASPRVVSVAAPANGAYGTGRSLTFTVNFHEAVTVTGTPQLAVTVGSTTRQASYVSGSGSSSLVFSYEIQAGETDANGVTVGALTLNGGTLKDASGNDATLTLNSVGSTSAVLVDGVSPTVAYVSTPSSGDYKAGDTLTFAVNFDEAVTVTGAPRLNLAVGSGVQWADYVSGSGGVELLFRYTVQSGDSAMGVSVGLLSDNGGTLKDAAGNDANLTLNYVGSTSNIRIDAVAPTIASATGPAAATYKAGDALNFTVNFSEAVTVTGTPKLALTLDTGGTVDAIYVSGSGTSALVFRYTVQSGDADANGVALGSSIALNGGTVKDAVGNNAVLTGVSASGLAGVKVDGVAPTLASVMAPAAGTYKVGDTLDFTVNFSEAITVAGAPKLALTLDAGGTVDATYVSGSGTSALVFRYTVQAGDADANGVTLGASIVLNGGTLTDAAGNAPALALNNVASTATVLVDGVAPTLVSAAGPSAATYKVGDALNFTINFSEAVRVTGTPKLALTLDTGGTVDATYVSGSGTSALVFRYTVQAGNADADGVSLGSSIALNGGTLTDAAGNAAPLTGFSVSGLAGVKVNGVGPAAQSIARVGAAVSKAATQAFTVTFSEAVTGVDASDFVLTTTGTAGGAITGVTGSGTTYTVSVGSVTGDGTLRLDLKGSGTGIVNGLSNPIGGGFATGQSFTIDNTAPAAPTIATVAGDDTIGAGEVSGLALTGTIEAGATVALTIGGVAKTASVSGTTWTYAVTQAEIDALGAGTKTIAVTATDAAGNVGATATHTVTIAAGALTPEPEPEPEPQPEPRPPTLVDVADRPAVAFVALALDNLGITPGSTKTASLTVTLPDGSVAESTAARVQADINSAIVQFKAGLITQAVFEQRLTLAVAPTTGVAHDAYKFFTGGTPTDAGMTWLIDSADNPNDLTDGYYARFTAENRYINFAVNLGKLGEGRAGFQTQYGGLTFAEAVTKAYGEIIGATEAQSAGVDVAAALRYIQSQEAYFRALGGDDLGAKAAMAGYVLSVGTSFHVGKYYAALEDYVVGAITAGASAQAAAPAWDLG